MKTACDAARAEIVSGGGASAHVDSCGPCRAFAARLARVDRSLAAAADDAASAALPAALRARIVAAARPAAAVATAPPRGRVLDLALRAAAVAAILFAAFAAMPDPAEAAELSLPRITMPRIELPTSLPDPRSVLPSIAAAPPVDVPGAPIGAALGAVLLAAAGWMLVRARRAA